MTDKEVFVGQLGKLLREQTEKDFSDNAILTAVDLPEDYRATVLAEIHASHDRLIGALYDEAKTHKAASAFIPMIMMYLRSEMGK